MKRAALLIALGALLWFSLRAWDEAPQDAAARLPTLPTGSDTSPRMSVPDEPLPEEAPASQPAPIKECLPDASAHCFAGALYAWDSCGVRGELLDDCAHFGCVDDECVKPPSGPSCPQELGETGRCAGGVLEYCRAGVVMRTDCARMGRVCALGLDGEAACLPPLPKGCAQLPPDGRCEGNTAIICQGGKLITKVCTLGSHCATAGGAHCEWITRFRSAVEATSGCSLCGCTSNGPLGPEICDGFDNDRDGMVDNGALCQTVEIRAVIPRDRRGNPSATVEQITDELREVNAVFDASGHETGLRFTLGDVLYVDAWLVANETSFEEALASPVVHAPPFRVPVLFAQRIEMNGREPPGIATLPNGTCADLQRVHAPQNGRGLVAVGEYRYKTTLAHELGHYLGLCHTHQPNLARDVIIHQTPTASYRCADCLRSGDGICDTPADPGADTCATDASCSAQCPGGDVPDATNIMSYYTRCRARFSREQALQLHRYLARRKLWAACADDPSACACNTLTPCPTGMMMSCELNASRCVPE